MFHKPLLLFGIALAVFAGFACGSPQEVKPGPHESTRETVDLSEDPTETLRELLTAFSSGTYTAKYAIDSTGLYGDEPDAPPVEMTTTEVRKGTEYMRGTIELGIEGETYSISTIITPDVTAICADEIGPLFFLLQVADRTCIDVVSADPSATDALTDPLGLFTETELQVVDVISKEIQGTSTTCYEVDVESALSSFPGELESDEPVENALLCWDDSDRLVHIAGANSSEGARTLIEYSNLVAEDAFDLPYPLESNSESLEIRNETDVPIFVHGQQDDSGFNYGTIEILPGEVGVLEPRGRGMPSGIYLGTYQLPQWSWGCTWDDAKANEPLVVRDQSANCTDTSGSPSALPTTSDGPAIY